MQKSTLYGVMAVGLVLVTAGVNRFVPRLPVPVVRPLALEVMPRTIGQWENEKDNPIDALTRRALPEAHLLSRNYHDPVGHSLELFLESSANQAEYHVPTYCTTAQGWAIASTSQWKLQDIDVTELHLERNGARAVMLYWYVSEGTEGHSDSMLTRLMSDRVPNSLSVHITAPVDFDYDSTDELARRFTADALPMISEKLLRLRLTAPHTK